MKLYHVTKDLTHDGNFTPRVPERRDYLEDEVIPRICFSTSIEGALSALPIPRGSSFADYNENYGYVWKVFEVDTDDLPNEQWVDSQTLYEEGLVLDTWLTEEVWVTQPLDLSNQSYYILIDDWEFFEMEKDDHDRILSELGWKVPQKDVFEENEYKSYVCLMSNTLGLMPQSFKNGAKTIKLEFQNYLPKEEIPKLLEFCATAPGIWVNDDELDFHCLSLTIQDNEALQRLCLFLGFEWTEWFPLTDLY